MSTDTDGAGDEDPTTPVEISLTLGESGDLWVARATRKPASRRREKLCEWIDHNR